MEWDLAHARTMCYAEAGRGMDSGVSTTGGIMPMHLQLQPILALIAGILILIYPKILNFVVAIYLIAVGVLGLLR